MRWVLGAVFYLTCTLDLLMFTFLTVFKNCGPVEQAWTSCVSYQTVRILYIVSTVLAVVIAWLGRKVYTDHVPKLWLLAIGFLLIRSFLIPVWIDRNIANRIWISETKAMALKELVEDHKNTACIAPDRLVEVAASPEDLLDGWGSEIVYEIDLDNGTYLIQARPPELLQSPLRLEGLSRSGSYRTNECAGELEDIAIPSAEE